MYSMPYLLHVQPATMGVYAYPHSECLENVLLMDHEYRVLLTVYCAEWFLSTQP